MEKDTLSITGGAVATAGQGPVAGDESVLCVCVCVCVCVCARV